MNQHPSKFRKTVGLINSLHLHQGSFADRSLVSSLALKAYSKKHSNRGAKSNFIGIFLFLERFHRESLSSMNHFFKGCLLGCMPIFTKHRDLNHFEIPYLL
jgi:hypothetical protein